MKKVYLLEEVLKNDNLIFNLKNDNIFKLIFLSKEAKKYLVLLIHVILGYSYEDLENNIYFGNIEFPNNINNKSSYSDLVCKYKKTDIIIEMNNENSKKLLNKNYHYLFKQHTRKSNNKNNYGENNKTILINIDNFDILGKKNFIYKSNLKYDYYNVCIYNNIKIIHINLEYLSWKYYNEYELNYLEKILLIFVEQRIDKILDIVKIKEVEDILKMIERLKFEEHNGIVTYDREEFEKMLKEEFEEEKKNFEKKKNKFNMQKSNFERQQFNFMKKQSAFDEKQSAFDKKQSAFDKKQSAFDKKQSAFDKKQSAFDKKQSAFDKKQVAFNKKQNDFENQKKTFAKVLKERGISIDEIINITKLTSEEIKTL